MTPAELTAYLDAMRAGRCQSAEIILPGGIAIRAVFQIDMGLDMPGTLPGDPTPGGWKDPQ